MSDTGIADIAALPPLPTTSRTTENNNPAAGLSEHLKRLSLTTASATALPSSSPVISPAAGAQKSHAIQDSDVNKPPIANQLRRTTSSSSLTNHQRSSTPTLSKRTSISSLQGVGGVTPPRSPSIMRRASSNLLSTSSTGMPIRSLLSTGREETPAPLPLNAATIAKEHFEKEIEVHQQLDYAPKGERTVVILHDACYGHRYSRPRTSKANLGTIVERPERIHASILGVSAAYVRLGGRHADGKYAPHPKKDPKLLKHVPFRIRKTSRSIDLGCLAVTSIHGTKWMEELKLMCDTAEAKLALNGKELIRPAGTGGANDADKPKLHEGDLYLCSESRNAFEGALGGVCDGVDAVFQPSGPGGPSRAFVCIRPPGHHCSSSYPSGFCWLNNVHVGIAYASINYGLTHAAIIDFDLHHGDGSQAIAWAHNAKIAALPKTAPNWKKSPLGYFSLHDVNSYPCEMGDEDKIRNASLCLEDAHGQSIWNVHLHPWKSDAEFWDLYESRYQVLLDKARAFLKTHTQRLLVSPNQPTPRAAIFLSAGFDASEWESPGMQRHKVNVPTDFYARFTRDIVKLSEEDNLGVEGRIVSVLEGGYSDRALSSGILSHLSGLADENSTNPRKADATANGLGYEMGRRMGVLSLDDQAIKEEVKSTGPPLTFNPSWWAPPRLEELEALANPTPVPPVPKKTRNIIPATYTSPTQSFTAKIVSAPKERRSLSGLGSTDLSRSPSRPVSRAPSPPVPDVDWATASYELSKLLIPSDRQTRSCKPEELNTEASRVRRNRHSTIGISADTTVPEGNRMQLRERRSKPPSYALAEDAENGRPVSRTSRRKTIGVVSVQQDPMVGSDFGPPMEGFMRPTEQSIRRLSVASSVGSVNGDRAESTKGDIGSRQLSKNLASTAPNRSTSSASVRPDSSISNRTQAVPAVTRKSKVGNGTLTDIPKTRKRTPPVPRIPSGYSRLPSTSEVEPANETHKVNGGGQTSSDMPEDVRVLDVDHLASNMKKLSIKLKLPSKSQQEAKEAKKAAEKKKQPTKATRKPGAPRTTKTGASTRNTPQIPAALPRPADAESGIANPSTVTPTETHIINGTSAGIEASQSDLSQIPSASDAPTALSAPSISASPTQQKMPDTSITTDFVPSDGHHLPSAPATVPATNPNPLGLPLQNPTTSPQAKRTREDLPTFTASSSIPFSVNDADTPINPVVHSLVPALLHAAQLHSQRPETTGAVSPENKEATRRYSPIAAAERKTGGPEQDKREPALSAVDIWDVPETPVKRP